MKRKMIFALCLGITCMFFTGCGDDVENLSINEDNKVTSTTSQTDDKSKKTTDVKTTASVTENKTEKTTAVSETKVDSKENVTEKADETIKSDNDSPAPQDTPHDGQQNNNPVPAETAPVASSNQASFEEGDFTFTYSGHSVVLGENINGFTESVPADSHLSSPSCLGNGEGENLKYIYSSFVIDAYKLSDKIIVTGIDFTASDVKTAKNIKINSSVDELVNAYGSNYEKQGSEYVYSIGDKSIRFNISGDKVTGIMYFYDLNL